MDKGIQEREPPPLPSSGRNIHSLNPKPQSKILAPSSNPPHPQPEEIINPNGQQIPSASQSPEAFTNPPIFAKSHKAPVIQRVAKSMEIAKQGQLQLVSQPDIANIRIKPPRHALHWRWSFQGFMQIQPDLRLGACRAFGPCKALTPNGLKRISGFVRASGRTAEISSSY